MNSYFSLYYVLIFLPIVILLYFLTPKKYKYIVLLIASLVFYILISSYLLIYLAITAISIYLIGLKISKNKTLDAEKFKKRNKLLIILVISLNLLILVILKYYGFLCLNINNIFSLFKLNIQMKIPRFVLPIGISFYTLQAISYIVDVNRGIIKAERNFLKLLLFLSFFPIIIEGPICRYNEVAPSLFNENKVTVKNLRYGYLRILYGMIKKIVIADRLNLFVKTIFTNYNDYNGSISLLAAIFYTVLLYMEFSGTMDIVMGSAEIFDVKLHENFERPFFSKSISEFWTRWHISLGRFFKDYVYYPISLSKFSKKIRKVFKGKISAYNISLIISLIALLVVWLLNGIWHGSGYTYIAFGLYHFILISMGNIFNPLTRKITTKLKINKQNKIYIGLIILKTSFLVVIGEIFFRANSLTDAFNMIAKIFTDFSFKALLSTNYKAIGLDSKDFLIIGVTLAMVFIVSILKEKKVNVRDLIEQRPMLLRFSIYYILIFYLIIFGAYGIGYIPVDPIYANF